MTNPQIPNPITDVVNSTFKGAIDPSLAALMLIGIVLVVMYLGTAALLRRTGDAAGKPKPIDLIFGLAAAAPLTGLIVLGASGLAVGLVIGAFPFVMGVTLWGVAHRGGKSPQQVRARVR